MKLWIARDKHIPDGTFPYPEGFNGDLFLYGSEPYIKKYVEREGIWTCKREEFIELDYKLFPEVTFENSPQEVVVKTLINEKENIVKILKTYDNIFGLSDGGIARSDEDIEYAANVILKSLKESNL